MAGDLAAFRSEIGGKVAGLPSPRLSEWERKRDKREKERGGGVVAGYLPSSEGGAAGGDAAAVGFGALLIFMIYDL